MNLGGQAVVEGVLLRKANKYVIAVRKGKKIIIKKGRIKKPKKIWKKIFFRGLYNLYETLKLGIFAIEWSSNQQLGKEEKIKKWELALTFTLTFIFAIALFILAPFYLAKIFIGNGLLFNLLDGLFRIIIFLAYLFIISFLKDIKRFYQYHGAEHKVVNCYEKGLKLSYENIKKQSTLHKRCGTVFIFLVLIVSIILFSFILGATWFKILARLLLIPVVVSFSYEIMLFSSKFSFGKFFILPGLLFQKITTKEPTKRQVEVAIKALKCLIKKE